MSFRIQQLNGYTNGKPSWQLQMKRYYTREEAQRSIDDQIDMYPARILQIRQSKKPRRAQETPHA